MLDIIQKQLHRFLLPHHKILFNSLFQTALIYFNILYIFHVLKILFLLARFYIAREI